MKEWLIIAGGLICLVLFIIAVVYLLVLIFQKLRRKYQAGGEGSPKNVQIYSKNKEYREEKHLEEKKASEVTVVEGIKAQFGISEEWVKIYNDARKRGVIFPQLKKCNGCRKEVECWGNKIVDLKE